MDDAWKCPKCGGYAVACIGVYGSYAHFHCMNSYCGQKWKAKAQQELKKKKGKTWKK